MNERHVQIRRIQMQSDWAVIILYDKEYIIGIYSEPGQLPTGGGGGYFPIPTNVFVVIGKDNVSAGE